MEFVAAGTPDADGDTATDETEGKEA
jgi:hypothetical protein